MNPFSTTLAFIWMSFLAMDVDSPIWLQAAKELGSFGIVLYIVWHYTTKVAPKMVDNFANQLERQRQDFLSAQTQQRMDYANSKAEDRLELRRLSDAIDKLGDRK